MIFLLLLITYQKTGQDYNNDNVLLKVIYVFPKFVTLFQIQLDKIF